MDDWAGMPLLLADADAKARAGLARRLRHDGYLVFETGRGDEALSFAAVQRLAAAVIDARLGDMSGGLLAARLRAIDSAIPVIVTAAGGMIETERAAREAGIAHYRHKPVSPRRLAPIVERVIAAAGREPRMLAAQNRSRHG